MHTRLTKMTRLSIGQRIAASFALLILPVALVATFILSQQVSLFRNIREQAFISSISNDLLAGQLEVVHFHRNLQQAADAENRDKVISLLKDFNIGSLFENLDQLEQLPADLTDIQTHLIAIENLNGQVGASVGSGDWIAAQSLVANELSIVTSEFGQAVDVYLEEMSLVDASSMGQTRFILTALFGFGAILFLILLVGMVMTVSVSIPLGQLREGLTQWQEGDFSHRVEIWGHSELTEVGSMMNGIIDLVESGRSRVHDSSAEQTLSATELLSDRIYGLETSLAIARTVTSISDLEILLPQVVELLRHRYNLYHVAIYLVDPKTDLLVLESGILLDDNRTLPINEKG